MLVLARKSNDEFDSRLAILLGFKIKSSFEFRWSPTVERRGVSFGISLGVSPRESFWHTVDVVKSAETYGFERVYITDVPLSMKDCYVALALCAVWGVVVERIAVRPFVRRGSNAWLMATVALGIILENVTLFLFGKEPRNYPSLLADNPLFEVGGITVSPLQVIIPAVGLFAAAALHVVSRGTRVGKSLLAVAQNPDAARLMGIDVSRAIALAYAVSTLFAGIAGILIAPLFNVSSDMGTLFGIKAFAVAIVGGITSASGVVVAGLLYGIVEALVAALLGSTYTQIITFAFVIAALAFLPNGLLGQAGVKKV